MPSDQFAIVVEVGNLENPSPGGLTAFVRIECDQDTAKRIAKMLYERVAVRRLMAPPQVVDPNAR